ncbi:FAD-dependent oxidoreductase [Streptomyces aculeolatus]
MSQPAAAAAGPAEGRRAVIVGGGMAGTRLARQLAAAGDRVTLVGEEPHAAYNRVLLADVLAGRYAPDVIRLPDLPAAPAVRALRGVRAVGVDRAARRVRCDDGRAVPYDVLVLATGAAPLLPPLRGLSRGAGGALPAGVHAFRTLADCLALAEAGTAGTAAGVVGGGLLGVSAARARALRGARVVLAQQGERLMERHLDPAAAGLLRGHLEELGVEVHTGCRVRGVRTSPPPPGAVRAVTGVELADGYVLDARLVVLACGVRPRAGLARDAGLGVAEGVVVDDELRTTDPAVHAIGDCAEHAGVLYGLAAPALEQADLLARILTGPAGHTPRYTGTRALTRLTLPAADRPLDLAAFGETEPAPGDDVVHLADATRRVYRKVVVRADRLVGGILVGDLGPVGALARAWEGGAPLPAGTPLHHLLTDHLGGS